MTDYVDTVADLVIRVVSPDKNIMVRIHHGLEMDFSFRDNAYDNYHADSLGRQIEGLGTLMWTGYDRAHSRVYRESMEGNGARFVPTTDPDRIKFGELRQNITADAESPNGWIRLGAKGMMRWRARVHEVVPDQVDEDRFTRELADAFRAVIRANRVKLDKLRAAYPDRLDRVEL
ncbi:MAG TPA: hypothetical protein VE172_17365 [Stackebrandtia sp.]|jgi:hypothetical protein|uniref:hypothetical protein n=1 Tax=Stackebrandtia sp. TaxID=2023065 RepID=UPI002D746083|nr:hypothetical protein [Stackebrandtia sp.]HZE40574.1 hypothetical protein [Stackebrandtia sp.]